VRIVVVENDPLAETLRANSRFGGDDVIACGSGLEALRTVTQCAVDLVVTNPGTSMHEDLALTTELRSRRPGVKIIALAPAMPAAELVAALQARVFACFTAPYDLREIVDMARCALDAVDWRDGIEVISGTANWITLRVSCQILTAQRLVRYVSELRSGLPDDEHDHLIVAFREMLLNSMEHGGGFDPDQTIEVTAARTARAIVYHFKDPGPGFDRMALPHAVSSADPEHVMDAVRQRAARGMRPGGFGILIAQNVVDEIAYNERGNEAILVKYMT
jgi:anti-sigma regulatory factor (Ser/Thr protein kinase)